VVFQARERQGDRRVKYILFHEEHEFLLTDVSIPLSDSQDKDPVALSPCLRLYSFDRALQGLFSIIVQSSWQIRDRR
jgi:hypothetical protein